MLGTDKLWWEYFFSLFGIKRLSYNQAAINRWLINRMTDRKQLCWSIICLNHKWLNKKFQTFIGFTNSNNWQILQDTIVKWIFLMWTVWFEGITLGLVEIIFFLCILMKIFLFTDENNLPTVLIFPWIYTLHQSKAFVKHKNKRGYQCTTSKVKASWSPATISFRGDWTLPTKRLNIFRWHFVDSTIKHTKKFPKACD